MVYKNPQKVKDMVTNLTLFNLYDRDHIFVSGTYENRQSKLTVYCPEHKITHETTFYNYNRSRTGLSCCGNSAKSEKLIGRVFSQETIGLMILKAKERGSRDGKPRRWRENSSYKNWRASVILNYNEKCAISGKTISANGRPLIVHHLVSAHSCAQLVLEPFNGILIAEEFHKLFHKKYSYLNNTVEEFQGFLDWLIIKIKILKKCSTSISSQGVIKNKNTQGPETRVYDLEQVMKLHERMGAISKILDEKKRLALDPSFFNSRFLK